MLNMHKSRAKRTTYKTQIKYKEEKQVIFETINDNNKTKTILTQKITQYIANEVSSVFKKPGFFVLN